jgi:exodeoxyribonuclease-3
MKIVSFNVNGLRAITKKSFLSDIKAMQPDILCLQETKANDDQVNEALVGFDDYYIYSNSAEKPGYSGTAVLSKTQPIKVMNGMGIAVHDDQGRTITCEFQDFWLVNTYVPNSGAELAKLDYRKTWDLALLDYLKTLEKSKPVIWCGDMNVAHTPMDLANPKSNYNKSAGYTQDEIDGLQRYFDNGFVDTFRHFNPDTVKYSWWSARFNSRAKNVGWRIDYVIASKSLIPKIKSTFILNEVQGSDHCPVGIEM